MNQIKRFILRAVSRMGGEPMAQDTLRDSVRLAFPNVVRGDLDRAVMELEADGYLVGSNVELVGIVWSLTPKGQVKVNTL